MSNAQETVLVDRNGPVITVSINRPSARNACDMTTVQTLHDVFHAFEADDNASVAVLTGVGETFCAGFGRSASVSLPMRAAAPLSASVNQLID